MNEQEMIARTKQFALRIMKLVGALPRSIQGRAIGGQLMRSGTSVAANYRAACRARSKAEFIAKLGTVEEEADESAFWLELIVEGELLTAAKVQPLLIEAGELVAITAASKKTASGALAKSQIVNSLKISKRGTVEEEADKDAFWLELIIEGGLLAVAKVQPLLFEAGALVAITTASTQTASSALAKSQIANRKSQIP
ncbi:MAG TPA: four helix bundle protein [Chthoniobacterales bacterium]|nr:four helix bundle protein [Chthoniobacterales bacterium]